jgi:hypothetical protein
MTRLRNETTGAVVDVPDEKIVRLGSGWVDADEKKAPAKKAPAKKAASSAKSD